MRAGLASIICLQLVSAPRAFADPTEDAAQVHLDRGIAAFNAGDFAQARKDLAAASELVPHKPNPYRWLALTEIQLGDCAHAVEDIASFVARVPADDARIPELIRLRDLCQNHAVPAVTQEPARSVVEQPAPPTSPEAHASGHRWWLWGTIGAVAIAAVGVAVYVTRDDATRMLPGVSCGADGCR
jgi:hypothetical protein